MLDPHALMLVNLATGGNFEVIDGEEHLVFKSDVENIEDKIKYFAGIFKGVWFEYKLEERNGMYILELELDEDGEKGMYLLAFIDGLDVIKFHFYFESLEEAKEVGEQIEKHTGSKLVDVKQVPFTVNVDPLFELFDID